MEWYNARRMLHRGDGRSQESHSIFVSLVTYIIPIHGLLLGALVLREPVDLTVIASLALILFGVLVVRT
jgi:drug/metabolite transporter (DMT)-like permease